MNDVVDFQNLTPERMIAAVEKAVSRPMTGLTSKLPSYINRVYEFQTRDGTRLIAKFYRPLRWSREALLEEHEFILDCVSDEIPVIAPMVLSDESTLGSCDHIHFAVFPKKLGREFEIIEDEDWRRLGRIVARIHNAGKRRQAHARVKLHPELSTESDIRQLVGNGFVSPRHVRTFQDVGNRLMDLSAGLFEDIEFTRLHGDCHRGNILYRPQEGLMMIDFDDMMTGPPIQDLWLLLPDHAENCRLEIDLILEGYELFRKFDRRTLKLIEPLRAMRIIYFLAWCSRQAGDYLFKQTFPDWGSEGFWQKEIADLSRQLHRIEANR